MRRSRFPLRSALPHGRAPTTSASVGVHPLHPARPDAQLLEVARELGRRRVRWGRRAAPTASRCSFPVIGWWALAASAGSCTAAAGMPSPSSAGCCGTRAWGSGERVAAGLKRFSTASPTVCGWRTGSPAIPWRAIGAICASSGAGWMTRSTAPCWTRSMPTCSRYLAYRFERKGKASSAARLLSSLKRFYQYALRER